MYGPPMSDSDEDDYDGFYFGDDHIKKTSRSEYISDPEDDMFNAADTGDLENLQNQIEMLQFDVNELVKCNTLLNIACRGAHLEVVQYLLDKGADPNRQVDGVTPLMEVCSYAGDLPHKVSKIVSVLLRHDVVINVSNRWGMTPFMFACKKGHLEVVQMLIKHSSFEAKDNRGWTALFHAIESNHIDIVRLLVDAGIDVHGVDDKGYGPRKVAEFFGFKDILDILPKEAPKYQIPPNYTSYNFLRDKIPRIFLKSDIPEYFPEIVYILKSIRMDSFVDLFAQEEVSLAEFLVMDDNKLREIGVQLPIHRKKIQLALLNYHLCHWNDTIIAKVKRDEPDSFYDVLMISANHLQNLIVMNAAIKYLQQNFKSNQFGHISTVNVQFLKTYVENYRTSLNDISKTVKYLSSFSPDTTLLYVDYDDYVSEKRIYSLKKVVKYTLFISISIVICLKFKRII